jgi:RND family efflux transporter MFP subunit
VPVVVSRVVQQQVETSKTFVATVVPYKKAVIGTAVDGRVIEVLVEAGDRIQAQQPLARLLTDTIQLELEGAQAELEYRRQQLAELENGSRPEEIQRAKARMQGAQARMEYLLNRRERTEKLYRNNSAVSKEDRDEATSAAIVAEQEFEEAKAAHLLAVAGARQEQIAQARAQVRMQQALVDQLADRIKKHTIISRFDGYVTAKRAEVGSWVTKGDAVVEVVALDPVVMNAYVPETQIPYVTIDKEVHVEVPAIRDRIFTGCVARIIPEGDARARTFPVRVWVKNPSDDNGPLLKAGMYARVSLPTGPSQRALLVPKDALVLSGREHTVYVVEASPEDPSMGTVRPVVVDLGATSGELIQVIGPLNVDQRVVVRGNERLRPGQDVTVTDELPADAAAGSANAAASPSR